MTTKIECVIQRSPQESGSQEYFIYHSPKLGVKAKSGIKVCNDLLDPIYEDLYLYSFPIGQYPTLRVEVVTKENNLDDCYLVTVLSVRRIDGYLDSELVESIKRTINSQH